MGTADIVMYHMDNTMINLSLYYFKEMKTGHCGITLAHSGPAGKRSMEINKFFYEYGPFIEGKFK